VRHTNIIQQVSVKLPLLYDNVAAFVTSQVYQYGRFWLSSSVTTIAQVQ